MMAVRAATAADHPLLLEIWRDSVRATHAFLGEEGVATLYPLVRDRMLPSLELWVLCGPQGEAIGFMGMDGASLDALFIAPAFLRRGGGRLLLDHARSLARGPLLVDVNEQNPQALAFYLANGFAVVGRSPLDGGGRPYPILHLREVTAAA